MSAASSDWSSIPIAPLVDLCGVVRKHLVDGQTPSRSRREKVTDGNVSRVRLGLGSRLATGVPAAGRDDLSPVFRHA